MISIQTYSSFHGASSLTKAFSSSSEYWNRASVGSIVCTVSAVTPALGLLLAQAGLIYLDVVIQLECLPGIGHGAQGSDMMQQADSGSMI